jgi:hypothetical protein
LLCCVIHHHLQEETVPKCCAKTILLSQTSSVYWFSLSNFNLQDHILSTAGAALARVCCWKKSYQVFWSQFLICKSLAWESMDFVVAKPDWVLTYIVSSKPSKMKQSSKHAPCWWSWAHKLLPSLLRNEFLVRTKLEKP